MAEGSEIPTKDSQFNGSSPCFFCKLKSWIREKRRRCAERSHEQIVATATARMASLTFLVVLVAGFQSWLTYEQLTLAKGADRPWLGFDIGSQGALDAKGIPVLAMLRNTGKRPAQNTRVFLEPKFLPTYEGIPELNKQELLARRDQGFQTVIFPDSTLPIVNMSLGSEHVSSELIKAISERSMTLFYVGFVKYEDPYDGTLHTTNVCKIYKPELQMLSACNEGNYAD